MAGFVGSNSSYRDGNARTEARPFGQAPQLVDLSKLLAQRPSSGGGMLSAAAQSRSLAPGRSGGFGSTDKTAERMRGIALEEAAGDLRAKQMAAPTKQLTGFNMYGPTTDVAAMNAYQRKYYLPDSSSVVGMMGPSQASISPDAPKEPEEEDSGVAMRAWLQKMAMLRSNGGVSGGGMR